MTEPWEFLPSPWDEQISQESQVIREGLQEIRFRVKRPVYLYGGFGVKPLAGPQPTSLMLEELLMRLAKHSLYARLDEVRQGYLTLPGGHRVGIAGRAVLDHHRVDTLRDISGLSIRRARAVEGLADDVLSALGSRAALSLLVASPPRAGKTTLIRDLARVFADGGEITVIIDERSEIAGCDAGEPSYRMGSHSDVLDGWPKAEGMLAALRALSPDVLVVDELALAEDFEALWKARWSGVKVVASVHLGAFETLTQNPMVHRLWKEGVFDALVGLSRRNGPGTVERVVRFGHSQALEGQVG